MKLHSRHLVSFLALTSLPLVLKGNLNYNSSYDLESCVSWCRSETQVNQIDPMTGFGRVHAVKVTFPVPNSRVDVTNRYYYHVLDGLILGGYKAYIGIVTDNGGWLVGSRRSFVWGYELPGYDEEYTMGNVGNPGTLHTYYMQYDRNLSKICFTFDSTNKYSNVSTVPSNSDGFYDSAIGVCFLPQSVTGTPGGPTQYTNFQWATLQQWYWHQSSEIPDSITYILNEAWSSYNWSGAINRPSFTIF